MVDIAVISGSKSDQAIVDKIMERLSKAGASFEHKILSAHRTPDATHEYASSAHKRGVKILIGAAGGAAHLAGVLAAATELPVLAVPMPSKHFQGLDSLLSMVQMPGGIPVATFSVGESGAINAALFSVAMLALNDAVLADKLSRFRVAQAEKVLSKTLTDLP